MNARKIVKRLALLLGIGFVLIVSGLAFGLWDNSRVRVHSPEQAVEMAKAAAGPRVANLPVKVETEQDYWVVRLGPDKTGKVFSYLVSIWDKRAGPLLGEVTTQVAIIRSE
jgi:hypothetical protein